MAFTHFHRHSRKYLLFSLIAILFTMVTFNITDALTSFTASVFGGTGGAQIVFKTSSGRDVRVEDRAWAAATVELPPVRELFHQMGGFDPYGDISNSSDLALAHFIFLAEADEMSIEMPPERADRMIEDFKTRLQVIAQMREPGRQITVAEWRNQLAQVRLTEESLHARLLEILKVEAYVRAVQGVHVLDPDRMLQLFAAENAKVGLEYVEFPFERYAQELRESPPADADLEAWFKGLPAEVIEEKYTRDQRFTIDLALVDASAWDPASVPADLMPEVPEPTDDEVLNDVRRDPKRHTADGKPPEKVEDVTAEARAQVKKDRQLKAVLEKLRRDFDAAVAALPPLSTDAPKLPDGSPDPEAEAKKKAERDERVAKEKQLFAETVAKYGLEVKTFEDVEQKALADIDPPADSSLRYQAPGLAPPGRSGLRTQSTLAARDRKWAYVVRVADEPKPREPKPFAEVKEAALEQWIEEHAKERALAKARELLDALIAEAEKSVTPELKTALQASRDELIGRDESAAKDDGAELTDEQKESIRERAQQKYWSDLQAASRGAAGGKLGDIARSLGLEVKAAGPHRASVKETDYYNDRFAGAERFLFRQSDFREGGSEPHLLGLAVGRMSAILVNDPDKAAYVAKVASREAPTFADMTPKDREKYAEQQEFDWERHGMQLAYANPLAIERLVERHEVRVRVARRDVAPTAYYPY